MKNNSLTINYPHTNISATKTEIEFFEGQPELESIFQVGKKKQKRCFVTDSTVASLDCMKNFMSQFDDEKCGNDILVILGPGEKFKTIQSVLSIVETAINANFSRNDIFVSIGGGVLSDITAFAASIYKRGINVQFVPTTLLSMVDACIGGKTGCDFDNYKNMIGSFFPAEKIYYFPEFIKTLSENQFLSGLAEAIKTALLYDKEMVFLFENEAEKIKMRDTALLDKIIKKCAATKALVVEKDFTEKNIRSFLNLGHTFAHALETISGLGTISHGEAVAWGISRTTKLSRHLEYCSESFRERVFSLLETYGYETSFIPPILQGGDKANRLIEIMKKDKKNNSSAIRLVLQKDICDTFIQEVPDEEIAKVLYD